MTVDLALFYLNDMLLSALFVAGPILVATLIVGLLISVLQVTTQIQEITLSYVPKILTVGMLLVLLGPWMLNQLSSFAVGLYNQIATLG